MASTNNPVSASFRTPPASSHYGAEYFKYQSEHACFGGWANAHKFAAYIRPEMNVLDFGCGTGYILANLNAKGKLGIEVNPFARAKAKELGIRTVTSTSEVEDGWADVIVSNHALEHCQHPLRELQALLPKVAPGGTVVFVVPCELIKNKYRRDDPNHHLYSWSPMSLANLFAEAGFAVVECKAYVHCWPPRLLPQLLRFIGGRWLFEAGCRFYGTLTYLNLSFARYCQIRVIARRA